MSNRMVTSLQEKCLFGRFWVSAAKALLRNKWLSNHLGCKGSIFWCDEQKNLLSSRTADLRLTSSYVTRAKTSTELQQTSYEVEQRLSEYPYKRSEQGGKQCRVSFQSELLPCGKVFFDVSRFFYRFDLFNINNAIAVFYSRLYRQRLFLWLVA